MKVCDRIYDRAENFLIEFLSINEICLMEKRFNPVDFIELMETV